MEFPIFPFKVFGSSKSFFNVFIRIFFHLCHCLCVTGRSLSSGPMIPYEFTFVTGTRRHAGTDAHVFVTIIGNLGKTQEVMMDDGKDHFEKGQTDVFKVRGEN